MKLYKASHTVYSLKYHLVWITKKRYKKFYRLVVERAKDILAQICDENDLILEEIAIEPDHIHLYLTIGPEISVSETVAILKSVSASRLKQEYPYLSDERGRVWGRGFFATTVNDKTTSTVIKKYIKNQWIQRAQLEMIEI
jgi:putative transposase